jgi:hypothetical protein
MNFIVVFLVFAASLWIAWSGSLRAALFLFVLGLVFSAAIFVQHATDTLPMSL